MVGLPGHFGVKRAPQKEKEKIRTQGQKKTVNQKKKKARQN